MAVEILIDEGLPYEKYTLNEEFDATLKLDDWGQAQALSGDGNTLVLATRAWIGGSPDKYGAVTTFAWNGTSWIEDGAQLLSPRDPSEQHWWGRAIAISDDGSKLVVSTREDDTPSGWGGIDTFTRSGSAWVHDNHLQCVKPEWDQSSAWGNVIAMSGDGLVLAVSSPEWSGDTGEPLYESAHGVIYIYDWAGGVWVRRSAGGFYDGETIHFDYAEGPYIATEQPMLLNPDGSKLIIRANTIDSTDGFVVLEWQSGTGEFTVQPVTYGNTPSGDDYEGLVFYNEEDGDIQAYPILGASPDFTQVIIHHTGDTALMTRVGTEWYGRRLTGLDAAFPYAIQDSDSYGGWSTDQTKLAIGCDWKDLVWVFDVATGDPLSACMIKEGEYGVIGSRCTKWIAPPKPPADDPVDVPTPPGGGSAGGGGSSPHTLSCSALLAKLNAAVAAGANAEYIAYLQGAYWGMLDDGLCN